MKEITAIYIGKEWNSFVVRKFKESSKILDSNGFALNIYKEGSFYAKNKDYNIHALFHTIESIRHVQIKADFYLIEESEITYEILKLFNHLVNGKIRFGPKLVIQDFKDPEDFLSKVRITV